MPAVLPIEPFLLLPAEPGGGKKIQVRLAPFLSMRHGTVLGEQAARPGVYAPYDAAATDGTQLARLILEADCATDMNGNITEASLVAGQGPLSYLPRSKTWAFFSGAFFCHELVGLDAAAVQQLGRLSEGTINNGLLRVS